MTKCFPSPETNNTHSMREMQTIFRDCTAYILPASCVRTWQRPLMTIKTHPPLPVLLKEQQFPSKKLSSMISMQLCFGSCALSGKSLFTTVDFSALENVTNVREKRNSFKMLCFIMNDRMSLLDENGSRVSINRCEEKVTRWNDGRDRRLPCSSPLSFKIR
jgi:hypothetical protein